MKVFISADMEGTAGINAWDELERTHPDWHEFRALMTAEVIAACEGARAAGATEVLVKDAHESGRNLIVSELPDYVRIIRGWSGHPDSMMFGLDPSFAGACFIGYHSKAGTEGNPLAHTNNRRIGRLIINGEVASEFTLNALSAAKYGVPAAFIAADVNMCAEARAMIPGIETVETLFGQGRASNSITPARSRQLIREGVERALRKDLSGQVAKLAPNYEMIVEYNNGDDAYRASWFPGVKAHGPCAVAFSSDSFFELQRALRFMDG